MNDADRIKERKRRIREMFNAIAGRYDLLNHLLSGGVDIYWRRRALNEVRHPRPRQVLDLATGTGDFALAAGRLGPCRVFGVDVSMSMLRLGAAKVGRRPQAGSVILLAGDAEELPFVRDSFDLVTGAFGVRNFGHIPTGMKEAWRVLKPGGEILVLDFSEPALPLFKQAYRFYFKRVLPLLGGLVSGNRQAYSYLPQSVDTFPQGPDFVRLLEGAGFVETRTTPLTLGISAIYQGRKPGNPVD